jgi:DNA-directed RNA polymerase subunit RPC12/RpoP
MRITEKVNSRSMSWNRMDTNFRSDQLRDVGVPEEFIDLVKGLDFAEIEQRYPEIAEWLEESAGVWNEPKMAGMFEDPNIMSIGESKLELLQQQKKYWEDRAIQIGLIGSDQDLIEADDIINELTDQIKQLGVTEATGIFLVTDADIEKAISNGMSKSEYSKLKDENDDDGIRELINKHLNKDDSWQEGGESMEDELQEWFDSLSTTDIQKIGSDVNEFATLFEQTQDVQDQIKTYYTFNVLQNQGIDPAQAYDLTFDGHLNAVMGLTKEDYFMNQKDELRSWSDDYDDIMKEEPDVTKLPDEYYELKNHDKLNFGGDSKASENACPECSGKIIKDEYDGGYVCKTCGRKYKRVDGLESLANEGRFRVADQGENTIHDNLEEARAHAEITGSPIWDMDKKEYVGEGGYGSGKNNHGFGHKKWMRGAELNDDIIDAEDMHRNQFLPIQVEESKANEGNREDFEQWWRTLSTSERDDFKIKLEPYAHDADYIEDGDYDSRNHFYRHWYNNIRQYEPMPARRRHYR